MIDTKCCYNRKLSCHPPLVQIVRECIMSLENLKIHQDANKMIKKKRFLSFWDTFQATQAWWASIFLTSHILCVDENHIFSHGLSVHQCFHPRLSHHPPRLASHFQLAPHPKAELLPQDLVPFEIQIPGAISPAQELPYGDRPPLAWQCSLYNWTYTIIVLLPYLMCRKSNGLAYYSFAAQIDISL